MEKHHLKKDIHVFYVTVKSFPTGIIEAFQTLEDLHPSICERPFYGIFHQEENGNMIYKAAVEEQYEGEGEHYHCNTFTISKGIYLTEHIRNFMEQIEVIPDAFRKLSAEPFIDASFPCIEWYKSDTDVLCMVKLNSN